MELIQRILSSLQDDNTLQTLDHQTITDLQTLLDNTVDDPELTSQFYDELASKNLSASSITRPLALTMDSGPTHLAVLAANVFLSLILSPNAPVLTIFTPMAFISLLRAVRRSLKGLVSAPSDGVRTVNRRKRKGKKGRNEEVGDLGEERDGVFDVREMFPVLERLELALGLIHLDRFPESLKALIQTVVELPVAGVDVCGSLGVYGKLCEFCCRILTEVLKAEHGDQSNSAAEVLRALTPLVLMGKGQARSFAMGFVVKTMVRMGKEEEDVNNAVVNFPKYLTQKAPEKSEPRALAVEAILEVVRVLEFKDQVGFVEYVVKMTQGKSKLRLLGVDLILMLVMLLRDPSKVGEEAEMRDLQGLKCLKALIKRCSDAVAGIRGRALSNLTQLVGYLSGDDRNRELLRKVMGFQDVNSQSRECGIADLLRTRCVDEKAVVRKAALHLVTKMTALSGDSFDPVVLKMMGMACSDSLVSIRKAAISALSEAYRTFYVKSIITEWLHSVPRLISDNESSIQEECENLFLELILDRISKAESMTFPKGASIDSGSNTQMKCMEMKIESLLPQGILVILKELCDGEVAPWVKKICTNLGKKKRLKPVIAVALQNIIRTSESLWLNNSMPIDKWTAPPGAWLLLSEVSAYLSKAVEWEFLHHHWQLLDKYAKGAEFHGPSTQTDVNGEEEDTELHSVSWAGDRVFLLQTISNVSVELPPEPAADLAHNLLKRIEEFNMHPTEINAHVKALKTLCRRKALTAEEADDLVMNWVNRLLSKASLLIEKYIAEDVKLNKDGGFLTPPTKSRKGKRVATRLLSKAINAVYTIGPLTIICPSADISSIIPILHPIITSGKSDLKLNKLPGPTISLKQTAPSLYIQSWLTMGKICLADGKLAKRYIPLFVQELEKTDCAALRNNLVVMMADFCVRYTALVDCYITKITKCLRDPCELVRRQTFILLSRLLQRDYVKWRGVLFLRFLFSLVDESEKIRQLAEFLFGNILKVKAPLLAYNSFVEAIFVLNDCSAHSGHNESRGSRAERRLFSIKGNDENTRSKRMHIYITLLKQMAPEHLLATFAKVSAEILAAASDGMLNIDDVTGQSVLQDAFLILSCKEIRLHPNRGSSSESAEMEEEGGEIGGASASAARGRVITQAVKKGLIQNTIPIFIELKRLLENRKSPLMGSLMECLRNLLKDYKNEIDEILVADQQLQRELVYDMQKYEAARAKTTAAEAAAAAMQRSSHYHTPGASKVTRTAAVLQGNPTVASAIASAAAEATVVSVLKEVNQGVPTPQISSIKVPRLKSTSGQNNFPHDRSMEVLESLRRRQSFDSDGEN